MSSCRVPRAVSEARRATARLTSPRSHARRSAVAIHHSYRSCVIAIVSLPYLVITPVCLARHGRRSPCSIRVHRNPISFRSIIECSLDSATHNLEVIMVIRAFIACLAALSLWACAAPPEQPGPGEAPPAAVERFIAPTPAMLVAALSGNATAMQAAATQTGCPAPSTAPPASAPAPAGRRPRSAARPAPNRPSAPARSSSSTPTSPRSPASPTSASAAAATPSARSASASTRPSRPAPSGGNRSTSSAAAESQSPRPPARRGLGARRRRM
jgi:hypothetical protein